MKALKMHTQRKGCFQMSLFSFFFLTYKFFTPSSTVARCVFEAKRQKSEISSTLIKMDETGSGRPADLRGRLVFFIGSMWGDDWQKLGI